MKISRDEDFCFFNEKYEKGVRYERLGHLSNYVAIARIEPSFIL